ncbi:MAG TPA: endonuclease [Phycisphaerae bacterium]|nr:endonuclease [Phycisphaerae bacterium]HRW52109.1 endonuclease [Phycisphaerae bacterium]
MFNRKLILRARRAVAAPCVVALSLLIIGGANTPSEAAPPAGYYDSVNTTTGATLRATLHEVIDDHTRYPYTSSSTDTWDILEDAQQDPANAGKIIDVYGNQSITKIGGGTGPYNREHSWPKSYGFPNDGADNYPYTDCFQLFLCDSGYNSARSNKPFRNCSAGCTEEPTVFYNGQGGGSGVYPGNSNWTSGDFTLGTWEVWGGRRGDIARAMFYMDVRYEGGVHGITGAAEPDLILTDNESLIDSSNTGQNRSVAYMGMLSVLLQWHVQDPVDDWERNRNDVVFGYQGNRNPFIDHPEWVDCIFNANCNGTSDGIAAPTNLNASAGDAVVTLTWNDNLEPDLVGYNVYRSTTSTGPYAQLNVATVPVSMFDDMTASNGVTYYYVVTAVNASAQESANSGEVSATPQSGNMGGDVGPPWINEFHYDNAGGDTGEFVEIAGAAGMNLAGWRVVGYNGNGGVTYDEVPLSGVIPDLGGCMGVLAFDFIGMQNGAPDGLALVDNNDNVIQFISYEGALSATNGPASGLASTDISVSEQPAPPIGDSLQLAGSGAAYEDFAWQEAAANTRGALNIGQSFGGCSTDTTPPDAPTGLVAIAHNAQVDLDWSDSAATDLDGYNVYRSEVSTGPYTQLNGAVVGASAFVDAAAVNCVTYYYVVTAIDTSANESATSGEVSATPSPAGASAADCDANDIPDDCQADGDGDGLIDACDGCPNDINKTAPGACGCGIADNDSDNDGTLDCNDLCPNDPDKIAPGACGCSTPDIADGDINEDGFVDGRDIQEFATALTGGSPSAAALCHGDFDNQNGVDNADIAPMINALLGN